MTQKFLLNAFLLFFVAGLASCSKDKDQPVQPVIADPGTLNTKLLTKNVNGTLVTDCEYFPDRRIKTLVQSSPGNPDRRTEFTYLPGAVTLTDFVNNKKTDSWTYILDNNGKNTNVHYRHFDINGNQDMENISTCTYNAQGLLVKEDFGNSYDEYFYENGMLVQYNYFLNGQHVWESKYEYHTDKVEKLTSVGQFNSKGLNGIRTSFSKYLIKRRVSRNPSTNTLLFDAQFTYELDSEGFVMKGKYVESVAGSTQEWINTYQ